MVHLEIAMILQESVGQAQLPTHRCILYWQNFLWHFEKIRLLANCQVAPSAQVCGGRYHPVTLD